MRVFVLGHNGMLGGDLVASAPVGSSIVVPAAGRLDVTDHRRVDEELATIRPDVVINAAAYTHVDQAELEEREAHAVNADAAGAIARSCAERDIVLVHYSTDYVFAGDAGRPYREEDAVAPLGAYGRTKLAGEVQIHASGARALVLRTQWLFGRQGRSFPRTMWERASSRSATRVVSDQVGCPTYAMDLARATWELLAKDVTGLFHVSNAGAASWYALAREVFEAEGVPELLSPCTTSEYPMLARRPADSRLSGAKLTETLGHGMPPWRDALSRFLLELRQEG